jgi:hypothetical protein
VGLGRTLEQGAAGATLDRVGHVVWGGGGLRASCVLATRLVMSPRWVSACCWCERSDLEEEGKSYELSSRLALQGSAQIVEYQPTQLSAKGDRVQALPDLRT